ncbi:MAG: nitroreductase family protein [Candidatus Hermodarchaeota archaeon]
MTEVETIFEIINNRRSMRWFLDTPVTDEVLRNVLQAGMRAPFASQLCSVVYTRDKAKMKKVRMGSYPTAPLLLVFLIDVRRLEKIMAKRGHIYEYDDLMTLWLGIQDVTLAVENLTLTAEALGLGSVLLGNAPLRADIISETFNIPNRVFPVVGMNLGYPDPAEKTEIRPRFPIQYSAFEDSYLDHSDSDIDECMKVMDEGMLAQGYYVKERTKVKLKEGKDDIGFDQYSWCEHISRKMCQGRWSADALFTILQRHGFNPNDERDPQI